MPALLHYPDRSKPFSFDDSEVIDWLANTLGTTNKDAVRVFEKARRNKNILFDPKTKEWLGRNAFKERYPST